MTKYDVVIVGSGLGGLLCGVILAKEGYKVCVLEKHHQIGGCLQTFVREGCIFDTGMHYFGSYEEGQIMHRYFKYFGLVDKLKVRKLDEDAFDIINVEGKDYKYAQGYDKFIESLSADFPEEKEGIKKYANRLFDISREMNLYNLREVKAFDFTDSGYITENAADFINSCTSNRTLQNVLGALNSLYAGLEEKSPLYMHALINNFFIESAWRFVDGSKQLATLLADKIAEHGGEIRKNSKVVNFGFENEDLTHVELEKGEKIYADHFISNIHPAITLEMCDSKKIRKSYRNRIKNLENTLSSFSLYCVLHKESLPYFNYNYYYCGAESSWLAGHYDQEAAPKGYMMFTPASSKSEKWADCLSVITYMKWDEVSKWENTTIGKRGKEYEDFKKEKAEKLIDLMEISFPDIRKQIKSYYTSTPLTYRDYTGTKEGSMYGFLKDCNNPLETYIPPKTRLPNLYLTGQNINLHGILGVTIGALMTCSELCGLNYLIKKINDA